MKCNDGSREDCNPEDYPQEIVVNDNRKISFCTDYHKKYDFNENVHLFKCIKYQQQNSLDNELISLLNSMNLDELYSLESFCPLRKCIILNFFEEILRYHKDIEEVSIFYNKISQIFGCTSSNTSIEAESEYLKKYYNKSNDDDNTIILSSSNNNTSNSDDNTNDNIKNNNNDNNNDKDDKDIDNNNNNNN